jgi:hypothetical protein
MSKTNLTENQVLIHYMRILLTIELSVLRFTVLFTPITSKGNDVSFQTLYVQ